MNKLNKIFLSIIIILVIALVIMTGLYFNMRRIAKENLNSYVNVAEEVLRWNLENTEQPEG